MLIATLAAAADTPDVYMMLMIDDYAAAAHTPCLLMMLSRQILLL